MPRRQSFPRATHLKRDGSSSYLRALMKTVPTTNNQIFKNLLALRVVAATNGLAAVKLSKIRTANEAEAKAVAEAFDVIAKQHATTDDLGKPIPLLVTRAPATEQTPEPPGEPQFYQVSGTPAYVMTDEAQRTFDVEINAFLAEATTLTVPPLTEADVASMVCDGPNGVKQPIHESVAAALAVFTDMV